jgi:hypothetical protein
MPRRQWEHWEQNRRRASQLAEVFLESIGELAKTEPPVEKDLAVVAPALPPEHW